MRERAVLVFINLAFLFTVAFGLPECVSAEDALDSAAPQSLTGARGAPQSDASATLNRRLRAEPTSLNPLLMFTAVDADFDYLLWDPLVVLNRDLEWMLNPNVVAAFDEASDHLSMTVTLRDGLTWHDGEPLTAADYVFSYECLCHPQIVARKASQEVGRIAGVDAIDARNIRFRFKTPSPANRWSLAMPVIPKHIYEAIAEVDPTLERTDAAVRCNRAPIGCGPYRFVRWDTGERIVLDRWNAYPGEKPLLAEITFRIIPDNNSALLAFEAGEIDETALTPHQFTQDADRDSFTSVGRALRGPQWTTYYIAWNLHDADGLFADNDTRQALNLALNRRLVLTNAFLGVFEDGRGLFHPDSPPGANPPPVSDFNLRRAAELLHQAGWRRDPTDGVLTRTINREGESVQTRFEFTLNLPQGSQTAPRVADIFREDLRKLGIEMRTQVLDWSVFNERNQEGAFDAYLSAWTQGPEPDDAWNLVHSAARDKGRNHVGLADDAVDDLLERARTTFDETARLDLYRELNRRVVKLAPYTFIAHAPTLWAFRRDLHGVQLSPRGPAAFYPGVRSWWRSPKTRGAP